MIQSLSIAILATLLISLATAQVGHHEITEICEQIGAKLNSIQEQMKKETDAMNILLVAGHIDIKDESAAKLTDTVEISKRIESLAKEMQAIYDDKNYLQFCVLFE
jgi:cytochrome bd-type quinol oxidase subunit 1